MKKRVKTKRKASQEKYTALEFQTQHKIFTDAGLFIYPHPHSVFQLGYISHMIIGL